MERSCPAKKDNPRTFKKLTNIEMILIHSKARRGLGHESQNKQRGRAGGSTLNPANLNPSNHVDGWGRAVAA